MAETVTAIYENGVLRPLRPLRLKEKQQVQVRVLGASQGDLIDEQQEALDALEAAGLVETWPDVPAVDPVSAERRAELARLLGKVPGKPLSEILIEERGEW
ncbi:MAG: antitoxin family protein [Candidatus Promineofilum sp.]|nr:antitoxin family protein [Promineifilum sp.]MCW5862760.1 antitoxin family protein [Anaerolineae bacterium]